MTEINAGAVRRRGAAIRHARAARVRMIRRRVIAAALSLFVATWLLIAIVLATGHDPALSRKTSVAAVSSNGTSTTGITAASGQTSSGTSAASVSSDGATKTSSDGTSTTSSDGASGSTGPSSGGGTVSSVTTRQS